MLIVFGLFFAVLYGLDAPSWAYYIAAGVSFLPMIGLIIDGGR